MNSPGPDSLEYRNLRTSALDFVSRHAVSNRGEYRYSSCVETPTLYSATYAVMTRSLFDDLGRLSDAEKTTWIEHFNRHQDEDGLYRDPVIFGEGWYKNDPFWCGRPHLTTHVLTALACLGGAAEKEFELASAYGDPRRMIAWLESRDWGDRVAWTGNEIMSMITILQYARDNHNDRRAGAGVEAFFDWMETHNLHADSGLWGPIVPVDDKRALSHAVQAAYHWWGIYLYDNRPVPFIERAVDNLLRTQNPVGGFGWGVHNPDDPYSSSACEDIDSIEPLARFSLLTEYQRDEVKAALRRALPAVLNNRTADGGFAFIKDKAFTYGHAQLSAPAGTGAMFPTWFRTLTIAILETALCRLEGIESPWRFTACPGHHYFIE